MERRKFLAMSAVMGAGVPVLSRAGEPPALGEPAQDGPVRAIAEGGALTPPRDRLVRVAIAVSENTTWIDFVGPLAAFETWYRDPVQNKHVPRFETYLVSDKLECDRNLRADHTFETAPAADVILVPAQRGSPGLVEWLRTSAPSADITMSVCIGARHLAKAGLLDGLKATTHHESVDAFKREYPAVNWVREMRFVEGPKISTGGGLTAGIDLGLRVCERYFGREWAREVAGHLEYQGRGWIVG